MPNLANAKKALRQNKKRFARNQEHRSEMRSMRRQIRKLASEKNADQIAKMLPVLDKLADKMVTRNVIKKNTAARIKSQAKKLHIASTK